MRQAQYLRYVIIAHEGINGTIGGSREGIDTVLHTLRRYQGLQDLEHKESVATEEPFYRMKVRIKKEIVTMGQPDIDPNKVVGTYLSPEEWNEVISDPETVVIDTRNDYEIKIGTFKRDQSAHRSLPRIPGLCAEKFRPCQAQESRDVLHWWHPLRKSIGLHERNGLPRGLSPQRRYPEISGRYAGRKKPVARRLFVFDQRVAVGHGLKLTDYELCPSCRHPIGDAERKSDKYIEGVVCPECFDKVSDERKMRSAERQKQIKLARARGERHIGAKFNMNEGDDA